MDTCVGSLLALRRLVPKTVNPARARASALARPMPEDAPVTIAVFPEFAFIFDAPSSRGLAYFSRLDYGDNIRL
jgi:hypothetical protein